MQPGEYDVVLGGSAPAPFGAMVLGGWEGVRQRFSSPIAAQRLAALVEARQYGSLELELLAQALHDTSTQVQKAAYLRLQTRPEATAKRALATYDPYVLFECLATLNGHCTGITAVAISPDGRSLISGSRDETIIVWDWWAQEAVFTLKAHSFIYAITVSDDGETFAIRGRDRTVKAWDLRRGRQIRPEKGALRTIASVALTDDRHLISSSQNAIKVWKLKTGRELCTLQGHTSLVTAVAVSADKELIISGSEDRTVRVWGVA
ncbi:MAG: WD40 repeat domain-containing protein [Lyngbya sp. HA4199-MV5]|jgi:WD40 repeat protein|nr:WD40 repeat domain-containing protein [Lyngbya sp. HA4199-MV5]